MSLSELLQSREILSTGTSSGLSDLKNRILDEGFAWYARHPEETEIIVSNLNLFSLPTDNGFIGKVQKGILLHYYEKVLPLCLSPQKYYEYLMERVDGNEAMEMLKKKRVNSEGTLLTISHFGAIELITPFIAAQPNTMNSVLRFTTQHFSDVAASYAERLHNEAGFGRINFIEIGKPGVPAAMEMAAALRRCEIISTVFDEETSYSVPAELLGKKVNGGSGLDKLISYTRSPMHIFNASMIRSENETYTLHFDEIPVDGVSSIQQMYNSLEKQILAHPDQWYFLHEEIPVIK